MKRTLIFLGIALFPLASQARDTRHMLTINRAMQSDSFKEKLDPSIAFYFGAQSHPKITKELGNYTANKKTNAFVKNDEGACNWGFLSALLSLQKQVNLEGGNAVVNIARYYKKDKVSSNSEFECHLGSTMVSVTLNGDVVSINYSNFLA